MKNLNYLEGKELIEKDYKDFIEEEQFTPQQAIAATFEDSVLMMKKSYKVYVAAIINLSILSLKQNFIPDYLLEKQGNLKKLENLTKKEQVNYEADINQLNHLLHNQKFEVDKDEEYKLRVNMLLEQK